MPAQAVGPRWWSPLFVTGREGDLFGTYRLRSLAWGCGALVGVVVACMVWVVQPFLEFDRLMGTPLWRDSDLQFAAAVAVGVSIFAVFLCWWPRLQISPAGVRVVNYFSVVRLPWSQIEQFDHVVGLVVSTHDGDQLQVQAFESAGLRHLVAGHRDAIDQFAAKMNAHLAALRGDTEVPALSVDSPEGRSTIRWVAAVVTVFTGVLGLVRLHYSV